MLLFSQNRQSPDLHPFLKSLGVGVILFWLSSGPMARAQTWVEPAIGYIMGTTNFKGTTGSANGTAFGLKIGYSFSKLYAGLEGTYALPALQNDVIGQPINSKQLQLGAVVGAELPVFPLKIWINYSFFNHLLVESTTQMYALEGLVIKLGIGMKMLPFLSSNIEYHLGFYKNRAYEQGSGISGDTDEALSGYRHQSILVSLSIPIDLPF